MNHVEQLRFTTEQFILALGIEWVPGKGVCTVTWRICVSSPNILQKIPEILTSIGGINHVRGVHHDPQIIEYSYRFCLLGRGNPLVHGLKPRVE